MNRLKTWPIIAILVATPALAQQNAPEGSATGADIIVTAIPLKDAKALLQTCLAQRCPPDRDINASLVVAEAQFVDGDYKAARATLVQSVSRNKRHAQAYPVAVSGLLRANARVAAHLGDSQAYFSGALDVVSALKKGLPESDTRVLDGQLELGDAFAKTDRIDAAIDQYYRVARRARSLALPMVEGNALYRVALLNAAVSRLRGDEYFQAALQASDRLIGTTDPALAPFANAAKLLKAQLTIPRGNAAAADQLIEKFGELGRGRTAAVLLYAPKIEQPELSGREFGDGETITKLAVDDVDNQWVDIGFQITSAGTVGEAEVLRISPKANGHWIKPILVSIAGRRYAPLATDSPSAMRVERYTFTASWTTVTGSRLRVRSPIPRIEMVDLTRDTGL
ncbi:hypothetical protein [Sphingomonas sp. 28-63-12]|uniref:hypothetical protein n=1 Tax=Sphingomonas sp. 28-63-12 TaxID=1970434 RepID=UPI000BDB2F5C|nr:MAG: hypothetical protein B7Y47_14605 [Sphingomonas sp. 28-63-12]